jgi:hypothetical protein
LKQIDFACSSSSQYRHSSDHQVAFNQVITEIHSTLERLEYRQDMDSAVYLAQSTRNIRTSVETFVDEVQGELEQHSLFGVSLTRKVVCGALCACVALAIVVGVVVGTGGSDGDSSSSSSSSVDDGSTSLRPDHRFWSFGQTIEASVGREVFDNSTHEYEALQWLANTDPLQIDVRAPLEEVLQRFVLSSLYFATEGEFWTQKYDFLSKAHECDWNDGEYGVFCNDGQVVSRVALVASNLDGTIPRDIGLLSTMEVLNLTENSLRGDIPGSFGVLKDLITLDLSTSRFPPIVCLLMTKHMCCSRSLKVRYVYSGPQFLSRAFFRRESA